MRMTEESKLKTLLPAKISLVTVRIELADKAKDIELAVTPSTDVHRSRMASEPPKSNKSEKGVQRASSSSNTNVSKTRASTYRGQRQLQEISVETYPSEPDNTAPCTSSQVYFDSGNPYVQKTEGIIHLFKQNETVDASDETVCRSDTIVMLTVPAWISSKELMEFINPMNKSFTRVRIVRDRSPNNYMVLIGFRDQASADEFYRTYNNAQYNSIEPDLCHLAYVDRVEVTMETEGGGAPLEGHTELPTCAVCLERMDESVESILTILCNHSFHGACLSKWSDSSCPVCRFNQTPDVQPDHMCFECQGRTDLWICLICGHIGCGRYEQKHAYEHFVATSHTFSLQVGTQRVWDYAGDNYVHRLIASRDGKPVEVSGRPDGTCGDPNSPMQQAYLESEEKIEGITLEYTFLLTSQLDSQRRYYEDKLMEVDVCAVERIERLEKELAEQKKSYTLLESANADLYSQVKGAHAEKVKTEQKHQTLATKLGKTIKELNDEREMNAVLRKEQEQWRKQVQELNVRLQVMEKKHEQQVTDLQEQLRDLMFHLQAESKIKEATTTKTQSSTQASTASPVTQEELEESIIEVSSAPQKGRRRKKKK